MSRGISGGNQKIKKSRSTLFILSKRNDDLMFMENQYGLSFDKINVIIACREDIYCHYGIQKVKMIIDTHNLPLSSLI